MKKILNIAFFAIAALAAFCALNRKQTKKSERRAFL